MPLARRPRGRRVIRALLGLAALLALVIAPGSSRAQGQRDICVEVLPPVTSSKISSVEVTIRDCYPHPPLQNPPPVLPSLNFGAVLEVSSPAGRVCGASTHVQVFGPPLPQAWAKVFRFQVIYATDPGPSLSPGDLRRSVAYVVKAAAQVADGTPGNNESSRTVRFAPGGKPLCGVVPKPPATKH